MDNQYMTTAQASKLWGISDRRVRVLCTEGKILGAFKDGKSYKIPLSATKPADGREKNPAVRYLKWENEVVGTIDAASSVRFTDSNHNDVVVMYTHQAESWTSEQFIEFLSERVVSRDRRDIERILFRCGLSIMTFCKLPKSHGEFTLETCFG